MPKLPLKPCAYSGCTATIREGRYCPAHKTIASREYDRAHRNPKNYDHRWRVIRERYIKGHPLCAECIKLGRLVPADVVHHILPVDRGGSHADENLMSLCNSCHAKVHSA